MEETRPLLVEGRLDNVGGNGNENINANDSSEPAASEHSSSSSSNTTTTTTTAVLLLATFVAVTGSFVSGCAGGYSSAAESGIREDLDLTVAEHYNRSLYGHPHPLPTAPSHGVEHHEDTTERHLERLGVEEVGLVEVDARCVEVGDD
ncbi:hypothetical protein Vadar_029769 [Vaccinium darrowii]|uniref:Uncharacterized protein n=1 Tax=Vaccinium darrowii TaxID=229202 RepID=A0ACB7ZMF7_9ERIC|nr:hypothetical protein Vadar_029769 [Vaccinium darrowii]